MISNLQRSPAILVVLVLTFGALSLGVAEFTTIWLMPEIAKELNAPAADIGSAASFYALGVMVGTPILALLSHSFSRQKCFTYLLLWCFLGNLLTSYVNTWEQLQWARLFSGMPHGVYLGLAAIVFAQVLPPQRHGLAIGVLMAGIGMALLLIVPLTTYVGEVQDWRTIFRVVSLMDLLIIILLHDLIPELPSECKQSMHSQIKVLRNPLLWWILALAATAICGRMAIFAYAEPITRHITHLSFSKFPLIVMCGGIGTVLGFILGGYFADINPHKTLRYSLIWFLLVITAFHHGVQFPIGAYLGFFLLGTFVLIVPSLQLLSIRFSPEGSTFASCLNHAAMNIANAAGPFLAGLFISAGHGWLSATWVGLIVGVLALMVYVVGAWLLSPKIQMVHANS